MSRGKRSSDWGKHQQTERTPLPAPAQVQAANLLELESNLLELQRQYCKEVDKIIQAEEAKAKEEDRLFSALVSDTWSCCFSLCWEFLQ